MTNQTEPTITINDEEVVISSLPHELQVQVGMYEVALNQENEARRELVLAEAARIELTRRVIADYEMFRDSQTEGEQDAEQPAE